MKTPTAFVIALAIAGFAPHAAAQNDEYDQAGVNKSTTQTGGAAGAAARARAKRDAAKQEAQAKAEAGPAMYPDAKRKEPDARASAKNAKVLEKTFASYQADDAAAVTQAADAMIANPDANAYERAVSARLAGAILLNADNARALGYLQKAIELDGLSNNEHYESMYLVAQLQLQAQQYAQSLATVDRLLSETGSKKPEHIALKGNALYRLKRYPEAAVALKQATDADPRADWMQMLMATYAETGQGAEATRIAEEVGGKNPNDKNAQLNLAATYMQAGQDDKAAAILEKLRSSGQLTGAADYRNLYAIYSNAGTKWKEAIAVIDEGMKKGVLKPDFESYRALAQAYYFSEQPKQAIDAYRKAAPLAPDGETYLNLARVLNNEGRAAEAREAATQALAKGVKNSEDAKRIIGAGSK